MFKFLFDTNHEEVQQLTDGSYQLFLSHQIPASKMVISSISIPYTFYNVNDNNNALVIQGTTYYIKKGNYTVPKLLNEFKGILKAWSSINAVTEFTDDNLRQFIYDTETYKFNFKLQNTDEEIKITFKTTDGLFGGFDNKTIYTINSTETLIMDFVADMNAIGAIMIRSNLQSNYYINGHRTNVLHRMCVDKPLGSILTYNNTNTDVYTSVNNINNLFIQITDDTTGEEISLNGGHMRIEFICIE